MSKGSINKLTVLAIRSLVKEAKSSGKPVAKADGAGLTFTVSAKGCCSWVLRYRYIGKPREYTIQEVNANVDGYGLVAARKKRDELKSRIAQGEDIALSKHLHDPSSSPTFTSLANVWFEREIESRVAHPAIVRRVLDKDILPALGQLPPNDIKPLHIDKVLQAIVNRGAPTVANDALHYIKRILRFGRKRHLVDHNLAADFELSDAGGPEKSRERVLTIDELRLLFSAMRSSERFGKDNELAYKVLLSACVRKSELVGARWEEFDFENRIWNLPALRTKMYGSPQCCKQSSQC